MKSSGLAQIPLRFSNNYKISSRRKDVTKEGSIVSNVKLNGHMIYDDALINKLLMDPLRKIQIDKHKDLPPKIHFPFLNL